MSGKGWQNRWGAREGVKIHIFFLITLILLSYRKQVYSETARYRDVIRFSVIDKEGLGKGSIAIFLTSENERLKMSGGDNEILKTQQNTELQMIPKVPCILSQHYFFITQKMNTALHPTPSAWKLGGKGMVKKKERKMF